MLEITKVKHPLLLDLSYCLREMMCTTVSEIFAKINNSVISRTENVYPPSRSTLVSTIYPKPHRLMASAVFSGSWGSKGGGARDVLTEQNLQPRVHVSPISLKRGQYPPQATCKNQPHHDSCCSSSFTLFLSCTLLSTPAVPNIWTSCLFTHCVKT